MAIFTRIRTVSPINISTCCVLNLLKQQDRAPRLLVPPPEANLRRLHARKYSVAARVNHLHTYPAFSFTSCRYSSNKRSFLSTRRDYSMGAKGSKNNGDNKTQPTSSTETESTNTAPPVQPSSDQPTANPDPSAPQFPVPSEAMADLTGTIETAVAKISDLPDGQMLEVDVGDVGKALLVNQNGQVTAIGNKCTHYGAPLIKGCLGDGRVRCPWHGACFNVDTGDIEDYPGLDSLARYEVKINGDDIVIKADKKLLKNGRRAVSIPSGEQQQGDEVLLIVGGGPASVVCIETLRQDGYQGKIVLCSREDSLPYDRPKLSKAMHLRASEITLKPKEFYEDLKVDLKLGYEVISVNPQEKFVVLKDGSTLSYTTLLLATGASPRTLPAPGFAEYVHLLREPSQANNIILESQGKKVVVIGTSFIGMEVAAYLSDKAASVDCIDISAVPFERVLGTKIGKALQQLLESKGVKFHLRAGVKEIVAENGKVTGVVLPSGDTLQADIVIAGVGVVPATDFLKDSGLPMTRRGEVIVDEHMKVTNGVYAAGDIAQFPLPLTGDKVSIGHWQIAHNHGQVAARNIMGKVESFNSIPYFWTVLFGKSLRYCGFALEWDDILFDGEPDDLKFAAYFVKEEKVLAVSSLGMDPVVSVSAELMYQGKMPTATQLKANMDIKSYLK